MALHTGSAAAHCRAVLRSLWWTPLGSRCLAAELCKWHADASWQYWAPPGQQGRKDQSPKEIKTSKMELISQLGREPKHARPHALSSASFVPGPVHTQALGSRRWGIIFMHVFGYCQDMFQALALGIVAWKATMQTGRRWQRAIGCPRSDGCESNTGGQDRGSRQLLPDFQAQFQDSATDSEVDSTSSPLLQFSSPLKVAGGWPSNSALFHALHCRPRG